MATMWISTAEAAQRLGVKPQTVYAYVSRGLLVSRRRPEGRGSLLDRDQVDRLASGGRRGQAGDRRVHRFRSVTTDVSHSGPDALYYRGHEASELVAHRSLPEIVELVLGTAPGQERTPALAASAWRQLASVTLDRRIAGGVVRLAEAGWGRSTHPEASLTEAAAVLPLLVDVLGTPPVDSGDPTVLGGVHRPSAIAARIAGRPVPDRLALVTDRLVAHLLDHGLTASTTSARAAASARAGLADCLLAGYGGLHGNLHGAASARVHHVLQAEMREPHHGTAEMSPDRELGFGHFLYPYGDPRAEVVLASWAAQPEAGDVLAALSRLRASLPPGGRHAPNIDAAIAVTTVTLGAPAEAGPAIFAFARTVGLAAHCAEEYAERRLRWRGRAVARTEAPREWEG